MNKNAAIMDLVAGYDTYSSAEEVGSSASSDAPATTLPCASASSAPCYYASLTLVTMC